MVKCYCDRTTDQPPKSRTIGPMISLSPVRSLCAARFLFFQWPEEEDVPGFKTAYLRYLGEVESLGYAFIRLVAEALGLGPDGLAQFYDAPEHMQHRSKVRAVCFVCVGVVWVWVCGRETGRDRAAAPPTHCRSVIGSSDRGHAHI
jgi:hypothetical protein